MERQLFNWDSWDELDPGSMIFYNVTLKVPIGDYPKSHKFTYAVIGFAKNPGILQLYNGENDYAEFELQLTVGKQIERSSDQGS